MESAKVPGGIRKVKKKQVKDEVDRVKQAEKKKRRLEKALATSAAIRSELEKKKLKKIEEQQRLDAEGAAIAEAVALHCLLGEDSDDSCKIMLNKNEEFKSWDCAGKFNLSMGRGYGAVLPHQELSEYSFGGTDRFSNLSRSEYMWNDYEYDGWKLSSGPFGGGLNMPYFDEQGWETQDTSAAVMAAQAVSSLQIAGDALVDKFVFNQIF